MHKKITHEFYELEWENNSINFRLYFSWILVSIALLILAMKAMTNCSDKAVTLFSGLCKWSIPETASSATLACCLTRSSLARMLRRACDSLSDNVFTVSLNSSLPGTAFDVTSGDWTFGFESAFENKEISMRNYEPKISSFF